MNIFKRIATRIRFFFTVDLPIFWMDLSTGSRFCLGCLGVILANFFCLALVICIVFFISFLNSNKTYELLYPAEDIANIQVVHIDDDVGLYFHAISDIPDILDQSTAVQVTLDPDQISDCIEDLYQLPARTWWNDPDPYIEDGTILITYNDSSREWISAYGTFYVDQSKNDASMTWYYFGEEDFGEYLEKYGYSRP